MTIGRRNCLVSAAAAVAGGALGLTTAARAEEIRLLFATTNPPQLPVNVSSQSAMRSLRLEIRSAKQAACFADTVSTELLAASWFRLTSTAQARWWSCGRARAPK